MREDGQEQHEDAEGHHPDLPGGSCRPAVMREKHLSLILITIKKQNSMLYLAHGRQGS